MTYSGKGEPVFVDDSHMQAKADAEHVKIENGFVNRDDSEILFNDTTGVLTLSPKSPATQFVYFSGATKFTETGTITWPTIPNRTLESSEGTYFYVLDGTGSTLLWRPGDFTVEELIVDNCFVAELYWDYENQEANLVAEERHGRTMASDTHLYAHISFGTRYGYGLQIGDMVIDGNGSSNTHAQFSCTLGQIWDEDIELNIPAKSVSDNIPVFYLDGANGYWRRGATNTSYPVIKGTTRAYFNNPDAGGTGVWGLTECGNNNFFCVHIFATNHVNDAQGAGTAQPYLAILGQKEYIKKVEAQEGAKEELVNLTTKGLPTVEFKAIATIICQTGNYSNDVATRFVSTESGGDFVDWRFNQIGGSVITGSASASASIGTMIDVTIDNPTQDQILTYDTTTGVWGNKSSSSTPDIGKLYFRTAANSAMLTQGMVDGVIDELEDETGIDNTASTNENYDATNDFYYSSSTNMTLISTTETASASPTNAHIIIWHKVTDPDTVTVTLNTDFKAYASRDGGTTWDTFTLTQEKDLGNGYSIFVGTVALTSSGTSMEFKLETLNTKDQEVHAVSLQWD